MENAEITRVGVAGEGKMGSGIIHFLAEQGFHTTWLCSRTADTEKLARQWNKKARRMLEAGILDSVCFDRFSSILITTESAALADCDLVIEAIPESADLKRDFFSALDPVVKPSAIFASCSSSINPSEMVPSGPRAERFLGMHFFYPVALVNVVELIVSPTTTLQTAELAERFLSQAGRRSITLDERNGFILNRIFLDVQNEGYRLVQSGRCTFQQMDLVVKENLFPFGLFDFCDSVGIATMRAAVANYIRDYPHRDYFAGFIEKLDDLLQNGRTGTKAGAGFYDYPLADSMPVLPPDAAELAAFLRQTWLSSCRRFTATARLPLDDANHAIREYFGLPDGPFG